MSIYQTMQAVNNLKLNNKGAQAFTTTGDERLDLFTLCSKDPYITKKNFVELYELMMAVCKKSPEGFVQLLTFHRSIAKGNGIKYYYYLGVGILEKCCLDSTLYSDIIRFSYQYSKDLYHVGKQGLLVYAEKILEQLFILLSPDDSISKTTRFDPMLFKYLGYEDSHWGSQKKIIQGHLNSLVDERITEFIQLVNSTDDLKKDALQTRLVDAVRELFQGSNTRSQIFTNRRMRILKTIFNRENHLPEYLFAGKHYDGTLLDESVDLSGKFLQSSIDKIAKDISQTSGLATNLICKTFKKWQKISQTSENHNIYLDEESELYDLNEPIKPLTVRQNLLLDGYIQYKENISKKLVNVKEVGIDLGELAYNYFLTGEDPTGLEQQLNSRIERLKAEWLPLFDSKFTIDKFSDSFRVIMDRSGSMDGIPLQTGLLYLLILSVIFRIKEIIYFDDNIDIRRLTNADLDGPILYLLKKIYTRTNGSTELNKAFQYLEENRIGDNIVVIISDGDCDPCTTNNSAFHEAFRPKNKYLPTNQYVVMNVNEEKMSFPYMDFHEKTCFITGTSTVAFLIEALIQCSKEKILLTPGLVLQRFLNSNNFKLPDAILSGLRDCDKFDSRELFINEYELAVLYTKWMDDLPKKETILCENDIADYIMDE